MRARRSGPLALTLLVAGLSSLGLAPPDEEQVPVAGSKVTFAAKVTRDFGEKKDVALELTGVALRQKFYLNIYAIGSYLAPGEEKIATPEALAAADRPKALEMVVERFVGGKLLGSSLKNAIAANHPEAFAEEMKEFLAFFEALTLEAGDRVWFSHLPGAGLRCEVVGKGDVTIANVGFAHAFWDIYFGPKNVGEPIKKGLVSRL